MAACGHAALRRSARVRCEAGAARAADSRPYGVRRGCGGKLWACPGGHIGRPYGCMRAGPRCRGALYMRPGRTAGISGPSVTAVRSWRHGACRPTRGRGQKRSARAACTRQAAGRCGHRPLRRSAGVRREIVGLSGRPYRPPLRGAFDLVRRAGCPHPAKPGCRDFRACRQRILPPFPAVGAACMAARTAPPELVGFRSSRPGHGGMPPYEGVEGKSVRRRRHAHGSLRADVGMPPYGVRRGCGGKCRLFGRICNPPLQVRSLPFPAVGAHYICARDALPGPARSAGYGENRSAARAAIKAAPTGAPAGVCRCRSSERERLPLRGAGSQRLTERCCRTEGLPQNFGLCKGR